MKNSRGNIHYSSTVREKNWRRAGTKLVPGTFVLVWSICTTTTILRAHNPEP